MRLNLTAFTGGLKAEYWTFGGVYSATKVDFSLAQNIHENVGTDAARLSVNNVNAGLFGGFMYFHFL